MLESSSMARLLVVEDDPAIAKSLLTVLRWEGFQSAHAAGAETARELLAEGGFDLVLLDVNLPDGNGFDLCREWRERGLTVPILFLTARTDEDSAVRGLTLGANDYVRKPFSNRELVARIRAFLQVARRLKYRELEIDPERREATLGGAPLALNRRELDVLCLFVRKAEKVVTREEILQMLGHAEELSDRTVDSHVSHVRVKLKKAGGKVRLASVYGVGYRLESE